MKPKNALLEPNHKAVREAVAAAFKARRHWRCSIVENTVLWRNPNAPRGGVTRRERRLDRHAGAVV